MYGNVRKESVVTGSAVVVVALADVVVVEQRQVEMAFVVVLPVHHALAFNRIKRIDVT